MKKYLAIFQLYFHRALQYRVAAWAGIVTQFVWGFLEILVFRSFYQSEPSAFPMSMSALASYVWLQQAFLSLYMLWYFDEDIFDMIRSGQLAYELVRPVSLYQTWYMRTIANRLARASLRCIPVLVVAFFLPKPYGLILPPQWTDAVLFIFTMILALCVVVAMSQLVYFISFYLLDSRGIRMLFLSAGEFLSGAVLPLPFLPLNLQKILNFLPFAAAQNVPFRIYSGEMIETERVEMISMQLVWLVILVGVGKWLEKKVLRQAVIQGG